MECATEPEAGAATPMDVPCVNGGAASSLYQVLATPEPPVSAPGEREGLGPGVVDPLTAVLLVTGATVSMRKLFETCVASVLLALSTE